MIRITYKVSKGFAEIIKELDLKEKRLVSEVKELGKATARQMKEVIKRNKKRPQAGQPTTLENNIDVEFIQEGKNIIGWGVGNISKLDKNVPYWKAVNFGSSHMVGKHLPFGEFAPGEPAPNSEHFRAGRYHKGAGNYSPKVNRPIPPMNYIERTVDWLQNAINRISRILSR